MCQRCAADPVVSIVWLDDEDTECEGFDLPDEEEGFGPGEEVEEEVEEEDDALPVEEDDEEDLDDADVEFCTRPAQFLVHTRAVSEHLCDAHVAAAEAQLKEGLDGVLQEARLADEHEFVRLQPGEAEDCQECGAPATTAHVIGLRQCLCREHALEEGATIPPPP